MKGEAFGQKINVTQIHVRRGNQYADFPLALFSENNAERPSWGTFLSLLEAEFAKPEPEEEEG